MTDEWFHFEIYVKVGEDPGQADRETLTSLMDTLAEFVHAAGEDFDFDPHVSGTLRGPAPEWAEREDDNEPES